MFSSRRLRASLRMVIVVLSAFALFGCATTQKPLVGIVPGKSVETLQSAVGITATSGEHSTGGRGYLAYKAPDLFHLALVSPFGQSVLEAFAVSDRFTALFPSKQTAYSGYLSELPETSSLKSMGLLKWVMVPAPASTERESTGSSGDRYFFDARGLLERKVSPEGDEVFYEQYRNVDGVAFPESIRIANRFGASVTISFEDPQVNAVIDNSVLTPNLEGFTVLPLMMFKGM